MNRFYILALAAALAVAVIFLGPYLDDLDARQATAQTMLDLEAEAAQLQADELFDRHHPKTITQTRKISHDY